MIKGRGLTTTQISQSMNIGETAIRRWIKQYDAEQSGQRSIGKPRRAEYWVNDGELQSECKRRIGVSTVDLRDLSTVPGQLRQIFPWRKIG